MSDKIVIQIQRDNKEYKKPPADSKWKLKKTRSLVGCKECGAYICINMMNGAVGEYYYQKGQGKRLCADCYDKLIGEYGEDEA
jgi:hypothetical protein